MEQELTAYCVKCRQKRPMRDLQAVFTQTGRPATRGACAVCGTGMTHMGCTPAHDGLPRPTVPTQPGGEPKRKRQAGRRRGAGSSQSGGQGSRRLVIVESPTKARTVARFLGQDFTVRASVGHVRDLLRSRLSVDVERGFAPTYRVPDQKRAVVKELKSLVAGASEVFLATDPDREGEAIAWHLTQATAIDESRSKRVVFHEITQPAIAEAFAHPRGLDMDLVNAQQARRILDRLVGYKISPLLWERVRGGLSAGRVQSVAVRLVVDREREIQAFVPVEYWSIAAELAKRLAAPERPTFVAKLARIDGQEVDLKDEPATQAIVDELQGLSYVVTDVERGQRQRKPAPPFTTSTLQQEASRRLHFTARRTMAVAQQLYEGLDIGGEGSVGLITYMRTDSVSVAEIAQTEAREYIRRRYGPEYVPSQPPVYKTRAKSAQEAHEAIRPTSVRREPAAIEPYLSREQFRLYELIWQRFVASQMEPAVYDTVAVDVKAGRPVQPLGDGPVPESVTGPWRFLFRATGSTLRFAGFLAVYEEGRDDETPADEEGGLLPPLEKGEAVDLVRLIPEQHFTKPPPRYTEATLVKALEAHGIGRPSTYAPILSTIQERGYVERENRFLAPTELGFTVNDLLVGHFPEVVETGFTAHMEDDLDRIAEGQVDWVQVLREFYGPFEASLLRAESEMPRVQAEPEVTGQVCEQCGSPMVVKSGRFGKFVACSGFPACRNTKPYLVKVGVACPDCGGELVERRARKKRIFYGCANYPQCKFSTGSRPVAQRCPSCGGLMVLARRGWVKCLRCEQQAPAREVAEVAAPAEPGE